jgi:hypothetical protein
MTEPKRPTSTTELLTEIDREWTALLAAFKDHSEAELSLPDAGGWSAKDNLAHLTEWMKILLGYYLEGRPGPEVTGLPEEVVVRWDFNEVNRLFFERNRPRTFENVMGEGQRVYADVVSRLQTTPFDELMKPRFPDDPQQIPMLAWVLGNTTEHMLEHRLNVEKALAK